MSGKKMNPTRIEWADNTWNLIPRFPGYYVTKEGKVLSTACNEPRIMKQIAKKTGYRYLFLYDGHGRSVKKYVHHLILVTFVGDAPGGMECRHLDGNPSNNRLENLAWGTKQENSDDKGRHGTFPTGERSGTHKLTEANVREIRRTYGAIPLREMASKYGVSHTAIRRAAMGMKWACVKDVA